MQLLRYCLGVALAVLCACPRVSIAAEFVINPLRVALDRSHKTGEFVVRNEGTTPLRMQLQAMSWRQDDEGKDQYQPDESLTFFPRSMEIPPGESRVVRLGVKAAPVSREDTYRLFVEELPSAQPPASAGQGASLQVLLSVGVPVFVAPLQSERAGSIEQLQLNAGRVTWRVVNSGSVHFRADQVELIGYARDGAKVFSHSVSERYFLAGATRKLAFSVPAEACGRLATIEAQVVAENLELKRTLDVAPASCR
jgi:fimbrial chaperone protein